jgi:hypothetical protein
MNNLNKVNLLILLSLVLLTACNRDYSNPVSNNIYKKEFTSSFETENDFNGFYITPQGYKGTSFHELSRAFVHSGEFAHKAWIEGANPPSTAGINNNHRGYPTIQFSKTSEDAFQTPCYITIWVWLDMTLQASNTDGEADWFSFATFTDDDTDNWKRTVLVNLSQDGFVHLQHVPNQGEQRYIFQTTSLTFPQKEWVELKIYLDFRENGYAKVWQNGELVSYANLKNLNNKLSQVHFGMYAPPQIKSGIIYNDDLLIKEVDRE